MTTIQSTNVLTREINLGSMAKRLAGLFGLLDNAFRLIPDYGFGAKSKSDDLDLQKKIAETVESKLLSTTATISSTDKNLLLQAGYHPNLINSIKKFFSASNEASRFEATKELYRNLDKVDSEALSELLKANDPNNYQQIMSALKAKGLDENISKLRSLALSNQALAGKILSNSAVDEIVGTRADQVGKQLYASYNIKGDSIINKAISAKLDPKNFNATEFLSALAHEGPKAAIAYSHDCIAKLQEEIDKALDQGIRSSTGANKNKAAQIVIDTQEKVVKLRSQQLLIAKLSTNKDIFGEETISALQKHAAVNDEASTRINLITEQRVEHLNTLAQTLISSWNANTSELAYQINLSSSGDNFCSAIKNKIADLKSELSTAQATVFPSSSTTNSDLSNKLSNLDIAAAIANVHGGSDAEKSLALQLDEGIKQGLLHDDSQVRLIAFSQLVQKIGTLADASKKPILKHLEGTLGMPVPSNLDAKALERVITIREHLDKLENGNKTLTQFIAEENLKYSSIYSEMQQNLSGKTIAEKDIQGQIQKLEALKTKAPVALIEPKINNIEREAIAKYLGKLKADAAGNVEIPARSTTEHAFVIPEANLKTAIEHFEKSTTEKGPSVEDINGHKVASLWIEARCKALIMDSYASYSSPQEKAEAYSKEYKPELYRDYQRTNIVDFIIASLKMFLEEVKGAVKHA